MARTILLILVGATGLFGLAADEPRNDPERPKDVRPLAEKPGGIRLLVAPKVLELRVQKVGTTTYFHVRLETPTDMRAPEPESRTRGWSEADFARLPRLVPQDDKTRAVYLYLTDDREGQPVPDRAVPAAPVPAPAKMPAQFAPPPPPPKDPPPPPPVREAPAKEPAAKPPVNPNVPQGAKGVLEPGKAPNPAVPDDPKLPPPFPKEDAPKKKDTKPAPPLKVNAFDVSNQFLLVAPFGELVAPFGEPSRVSGRSTPGLHRPLTGHGSPGNFVVAVGQVPEAKGEPVPPPKKIDAVPAAPPANAPAPEAPPQKTKKVAVTTYKTVTKHVEVKLDDGTVVTKIVKEAVPVTEFREVPIGSKIPTFDDAPGGSLRLDTLEFIGKVEGHGKATLLLLYPTQSPDDPKSKNSLAEMLKHHGSWVEVPITLDFAKVHKVKMPPRPADRKQRESTWPDHDDLEGQWAVRQAQKFAIHEGQTDDFGFYSFARELTGQKYAVPTLPPAQPLLLEEGNRLFDITTSSAAITEAIALNRLRQTEPLPKQERSVPIADVPGLIAGAQPWEKIRIGKTEPEPLAKLVPHDNYYLHFKNIARFFEIGDILDQWGTSLVRAVEEQSRDHLIKDRLEQQLCLHAGKLTRNLAPAVVKELAITGSDPYLREGSDVTVLFHVTNKDVFLAAANLGLQEAKKAHAGRIKEEKRAYQGIDIESYVTPLREVSLHRAAFDDVVVCSNSPAGVRRIIDAHRGRIKPLADALDFRAMRTIFRSNDPLEDGFFFMSAGFIRSLASPAMFIKERRRLEGLTGLAMVTNGALYTAWETGKLPNHHNQLLAATGLRLDQLVTPDGDTAFWNAEHKAAYSSAWNTLAFATPLVEVSIDKVTPGEQEEYNQFRQQFQANWRPYLEPLGMRISLGDKGMRWDAFVFSAADSGPFSELRRLTGNGTVKLDPGTFSDKIAFQLIMHLSPDVEERKQAGKFLQALSPNIPGLNWLGESVTFRLDDSPVSGKLVEQMIRRDIDPRLNAKNLDQDVRWASELPLTMGVEIRNPLVLAGILATAKTAVLDMLPDAIDWSTLKEPYKGVSIVKIQVRPEAALNAAFGNRRGEPVTPSIFYAIVDGVWWVGFREECIRTQIDAAAARKKADKPAEIEVHASVYVNPKAGTHTVETLKLYLEWETHRRAIANAHLLYPLYRGGIISPADNGATIQNAAMKYLGFVPVSPDYSPYMYEGRTDEIVSHRHGSLRRPQLHPRLDKGSPLDRMLGQFQSLRADLRFRDEGLHATVTFRK